MSPKPQLNLYHTRAEGYVLASIIQAGIYNFVMFRGEPMVDAAKLMREVQAIMQPGDIFHDDLRRMYRVLLTMDPNGIDLATFAHALKQANQYHPGDIAYLSQYLDVPAPWHATYYAQIVHDYAVKRRGVQAGAEQVKRAYAGTKVRRDLGIG